MPPTNRNSRLEDLPKDLLGDILSRVGQSSRQHIRPCLLASRTLSVATQDYRVYKNLNLRQLARHPWLTINNHNQLMEKCLATKNAEAHYIEGIKEYFHNNNTVKGLYHLKTSAEGLYKDGIYLYGLLMFCRGDNDEGEKYWDMLNWKKCPKKADGCWRNNQISLSEIPIIMKEKYYTNLRKNRAPRKCNRNDMDTRCKRCFIYKQMKKFIRFN